MKVGLDISQIAHGGGVSVYTNNLAMQLSKLLGLEMVYFYSSLRKSYRGKLPNVKKFPLPPTLLEIIFNRARFLPIETFIGSVDVFHSSDWLQPKTQAKKVTTYHDVVPLKYPQWSHPRIVAVHKKRLELIEKEVDCVIAVSEATKRDLLEISKIPKEKIVVIYEGVNEGFRQRNEEEVEGFRRKYKLPQEFILAIGGVGERRNLKRVEEAAKNFNLVITGETIPWVEDKELPLLYNAASLLLYPSLYEGFGLPIIEAMACGTPVITSNVSSMPEVGGDAALYVNPEKVEEMKREISKIMEDKEKKEEIIKRGLLQAREFSWEKCARETEEVYENLD